MIQPDCRRGLQILACKMAFSPVLASGRKWTIWINWLSESKDVLNRVLHQYIQCHKTPPFHNLSWSQRLLWALGVHACSGLPDYSRLIHAFLIDNMILPTLGLLSTTVQMLVCGYFFIISIGSNIKWHADFHIQPNWSTCNHQHCGWDFCT